MHDTPIRVDHVGIAVHSVDEAESLLLALGCERLADETVPPEAGDDAEFRWVYYRLGDASRIELIEPVAADTFLTGFLDRYGPGLHHVTLEVADIDAVIDAVESAGCRVVDRRSFGDWTEAFVAPGTATGTLFQLMEYHDSYAEGRAAPDELYVNGGRVGDR